MRILVHYHHRLRELAGNVSETVEMDDGATVADLLHHVGAFREQLAAELPTALAARNNEYCEQCARLADGDTVDIMPPVCGV